MDPDTNQTALRRVDDLCVCRARQSRCTTNPLKQGISMKRHLMPAALFATLATSQAFARDSIANYPVDAALASEPGAVAPDVALFFADQNHPAVLQSFGEFA